MSNLSLPILTLVTTAIYLIALTKAFIQKQLVVRITPLLVILTAVFIGELLVTPPNLLYPNVLPSALLLLIFLIISSTKLSSRALEWALLVLAVSVPIFALYRWFQGQPSNLVLGAAALPVTTVLWLSTRIGIPRFIGALTTVTLIMTLVLAISPLRATPQPRLNLADSWKVVIETLEKRPLQGTGQGTFEYTATQFVPLRKPLVGLTDSLLPRQATEVRPSQPFNEIVRLVVEKGLLGIFLIGLVIWQVFKLVKAEKNAMAVGVVIILISTLVTPLTLGTQIVLIVYLGLLAKTTELTSLRGSSLVTRIAPLPAILALGFLGIRTLAAEINYQNGLNSVTLNDGTLAYSQFQQAVLTNPYLDTYRRNYSQINLAAADALAKKKDLTDFDKHNIQQLIQQAVREGKAATALVPQNPKNWEALARLYASLVGVVERADYWAIKNYHEAISKDPFNPQLWIDVGGVYFRLENYDQAYEAYATAVKTEPTYANGHYNLAKVFEKKGNKAKALTQYELVLELVEESSAEYEQIQQEIEDLLDRQN